MGSAVSSLSKKASSASSSASSSTLVLSHKSRSVLIRLPETYADAQTAARNAFRLSAEEVELRELRLLIEGEGEGGDLLEVGEDVWSIVQPDQRVFVQLGRELGEEEQALSESGKRRRLEQGLGGSVKKIRFEPPKPGPFAATAARQPDRKGKGKGVAVASPDSSASSDEDRHSEVTSVLKMDEQLARSFAASNDASFGTAVAEPFVCRSEAKLGQSILDECDDYEEDYLVVKEHSNAQPFRIKLSSQATVEQLYRTLEKTTRTPRSEFTVLHENAEIEGHKAHEHLWDWSVKSGDTLMLVWLDQVVAQVLLMPRRQSLSVEAFPTSTYASIRARVASTLSLPLDDLYIVRTSERNPPFGPDDHVDLARPLHQPGSDYSALVPMQMWILGEADPECDLGRTPETIGVVRVEEERHGSPLPFSTSNAEAGRLTGAEKEGDAAGADVSQAGPSRMTPLEGAFVEDAK